MTPITCSSIVSTRNVLADHGRSALNRRVQKRWLIHRDLVAGRDHGASSLTMARPMNRRDAEGVEALARHKRIERDRGDAADFNRRHAAAVVAAQGFERAAFEDDIDRGVGDVAFAAAIIDGDQAHELIRLGDRQALEDKRR
jgi:hypothetical protein